MNEKQEEKEINKKETLPIQDMADGQYSPAVSVAFESVKDFLNGQKNNGNQKK